MSMQQIALNDLSKDVQAFLAQVKGQGIVVKDEAGRARYGITPYVEATPAERAAAWKRIKGLQQKTAKAMKVKGVTEADVERLLQEDD